MPLKNFLLNALILISCVNLAFADSSATTDDTPPISVVFLSPDNSRFWEMVGDFMTAAANDLNVDLTIATDLRKNRFSYRELLETVLDGDQKPDYILLMCKEKVTHDMLTMIGNAGIKAFTFNTDVPDEERALTGEPREKLSHWIGHISPDNRAAGAAIAQRLFDHYRDLTGEKPQTLVGLSGTRDSSAAIDRNRGFEDVLRNHRDLKSQLLFAGWSEQEAATKAARLIERYPDLDLIWNASDGMALGAIQAVETQGLEPGKDILVGGVDWEERALDAIDQGRLTLSLGRHFMGGGLALLLIRDYHDGFDFADEGPVSMSYELAEANRDNLASIRRIMDPDNWQAMDFTQFMHQPASDPADPESKAARILSQFTDTLAADPE